jgi:hypothetical protein
VQLVAMVVALIVSVTAAVRERRIG